MFLRLEYKFQENLFICQGVLGRVYLGGYVFEKLQGVYSYSCRLIYLAEVSTLMLLYTIIMCKAILRQYETLLF